MSERIKKAHPYYNFDRLFSYNATYMFCVGNRGAGKTYGAKLRAIKNFFKTGEQFIYLRRFKSEMVARNTFFEDLKANDALDPEYDYRIDGLTAQCSGVEFRDTKKREWHTMGYFVALSTAQTQKSIAYPLVTTIIFDEFIIEKGTTHYLPNEVTAFTNFYSTVDRWQDKTRVLFLANAVSVNNPYFLEYKIRPDKNSVWIRAFDGFVVANFIDNDEFRKSVLNTRFGRFIAETDYADYAVNNEFKDNNDSLLQIKDDKARYQFTLHTPVGMFSVWYSVWSQQYYAQEKRPGQERIYVTDQSLMREGVTFLERNSKLLQYLRAAFNNGSLSFDIPQTRNALIEIFKR